MKKRKTSKKSKKLNPAGRWKEYVKYLVETHKNVPLKKLLQTYKKSDYTNFCKKHCVSY
jgi:hypothetical protein